MHPGPLLAALAVQIILGISLYFCVVLRRRCEPYEDLEKSEPPTEKVIKEDIICVKETRNSVQLPTSKSDFHSIHWWQSISTRGVKPFFLPTLEQCRESGTLYSERCRRGRVYCCYSNHMCQEWQKSLEKVCVNTAKVFLENAPPNCDRKKILYDILSEVKQFHQKRRRPLGKRIPADPRPKEEVIQLSAATLSRHRKGIFRKSTFSMLPKPSDWSHLSFWALPTPREYFDDCTDLKIHTVYRERVSRPKSDKSKRNLSNSGLGSLNRCLTDEERLILAKIRQELDPMNLGIRYPLGPKFSRSCSEMRPTTD